MQAIMRAEQRFPSTQFTFTFDDDDDDDVDGDDDDDDNDDEVALDAVHAHLQPRSQLGHNVQVAHASR